MDYICRHRLLYPQTNTHPLNVIDIWYNIYIVLFTLYIPYYTIDIKVYFILEVLRELYSCDISFLGGGFYVVRRYIVCI